MDGRCHAECGQRFANGERCKGSRRRRLRVRAYGRDMRLLAGFHRRYDEAQPVLI